MSQRYSVQIMLYVSGVMAGILLESRLFHSYRVNAEGPSEQETAQVSGPADKTVKSSPQPTTNARIRINSPVYDFGNAETGSRIEHVYLVENIGTDPLVIQGVQAGCGCTTTDLAKKVIEPGGTTELKAVFDLSGRTGKQSSPILVTTNDAAQKQITLSMSGTVFSRVAVSPASATLGRIKEPGMDQALAVDLQIAKGTTLKVLSAEPANQSITARVEEVVPGTSYRVHISSSESAPNGPLNSRVRLTTDSEAPYRYIDIPVHGYVGQGGPIQVGDEPDISGPTIGGGHVDLKSLHGKVCVVVFWASWCGHCQAEMPELVNLYKQHQSQGLEVIGVNSDATISAAVAAAEKYKLQWPNIVNAQTGTEASGNRINDRYGISGIPAVYVIDRDGKVASVGLRKAALKLRVEHLLKAEQTRSI